MPRRIAVFVLLAVALAALFVRLGVWQLRRRQERLASNAVIEARQRAPVADVRSLPRDPMLARFRRARVVGRADWAGEIVIASRSNAGSPGVWLLTPVHLAGSDSVVLVNRGWVYSPDGATLDEPRWRDRSDSLDVVGYAVPFDTPRGPATLVDRPRTLRRADSAAVRALVTAPMLPFYVTALPDTLVGRPRPAVLTDHPVPERLTIPPLDEGPHLSYAIQWFSFALIALIGAAVVVGRSR